MEQSSLKVSISQIVLLGIADHYTRHKIQGTASGTSRVIGALLGNMEGQTIKIQYSTEIIVQFQPNSDEVVQIDMEFLKQITELIVQNKNTLGFEVLGWYSTTTPKHLSPNNFDLQVHQQLNQTYSNSVYMILDPLKNMQQDKEVPVKVYEMQQKEGTSFFKQMSCDIDVNNSEIIAIESIERNYNIGDQSQLAQTLNQTHDSMTSLAERLSLIKGMLNDKSSVIYKHKHLLCQLNDVLNSFPTKSHNIIDMRLIDHACEANLINLLSGIVGINKTVKDVTSERKLDSILLHYID